MAQARRVSDSAITMSQVVMPADANHYGYVHGGTIMRLVDDAAFAVATRHTGLNVVTASVDQMSFEAPIHIGDILTIKASLNFVGRTSMEVGVRVETERLKTRETLRVGSAYVTMVALGADGKPTPAPELTLETDDDRRRNQQAAERRRRRLEAAGKA